MAPALPFATRAMKRRFLAALDGIGHGRLRLTTPEGTLHQFGDGGPEADLTVHDWALLPTLAARGDVGLGEGFVAGTWSTEALEPLLALAMANRDRLAGWTEPRGFQRLRMLLADRLLQAGTPRGSARNVRAHYDVGNEFFQLWLDPGMTYSAALFAPGDDLERAQARKNDRILSQLGQGETVLELGCGWGGFAEAAAGRGRRVTGITLSPAQKGYADARLDGRADIRLQDYRQVRGRFDNIVAIEMIEAVGEGCWPGFFATIRDRLAEDGRAVLQAITVPDAEFSVYRRRSDYVRRHMIPGGMLPCPAVIAREAGRAGLALRESHAFGPDYARTCRTWAARMQAERRRILRLGRDERFLRAWQFYLEGCAATFAAGRADVMQITLASA